MSQFISLQEGIDMTTNYRTERTELIANGAITPALLPTCETFEKDMVSKLLNKPNAHALRVYLGLQAGEVKLILVAVDEKGRDILPSANAIAAGDEEDEDLLERGQRCPNDCPPTSSLND